MNFSAENSTWSTWNVSTQNTSLSASGLPRYKILDFLSLLSLSSALTIGAIGTILNALLMFALFYYKKDRSSPANVLITNQTLLEFASGLFLLVSYPFRFPGYNFTNEYQLTLCKVIESGLIPSIFYRGVTIAILVIAIERYVKIIHPIWHMNHGKKWMLYAAISSPWIYGLSFKWSACIRL
jgi:hypothetical protein